tara:strand:- start:138 stop:581 length:444 start_codon:yes stop_codon:yes gene_type:complete
MSKQKDIQIGKASENVVLQLLKTKFSDIQNTDKKNEFDEFDFRSDIGKIDFELKTRNIYKGQYQTIFFGENKLIEGRSRIKNGTSNRIIYLFRFNSRKYKGKQVVYFWEDLGEKMNIIMCGNFKRNEKAKPLVNLDIKLLTPLKYLL